MSNRRFCKKCKEISTVPEEEYGYWHESFDIIECLGCDNISLLHFYTDESMEYYNSEGEAFQGGEVNIYPPHLKEGEELSHTFRLPNEIRVIYRETLTALKANLSILVAGGLRAIIEATCKHLKIPGRSLEARIDNLHKKGFLSHAESKRLHSIRFLGNDALHEIEKPPEKSLYVLLGIVNHLLSNLFINDYMMADIETVLGNYAEFERLLNSCVKKDHIGKTVKIKDILAKKIRLVPKSDRAQFEEQLIKEIEKGDNEFFDIVNKKKVESDFKVLKISNVPSSFVQW